SHGHPRPTPSIDPRVVLPEGCPAARRETERMAKTMVAFHAHPDDEAIATAGVMMKAKAAGHRVVLVLATRGELGEVPDDLAEGETLSDRRTSETMDAARIIGADRVE